MLIDLEVVPGPRGRKRRPTDLRTTIFTQLPWCTFAMHHTSLRPLKSWKCTRRDGRTRSSSPIQREGENSVEKGESSNDVIHSFI